MSLDTRILLGSLVFAGLVFFCFTGLALAMVHDLKHDNGRGLRNWPWGG